MQPCKHWDGTVHQEDPAVAVAPLPQGAPSAPAAVASSWLAQQDWLARPPRRHATVAHTPCPRPQKPEFRDLAMQQINK